MMKTVAGLDKQARSPLANKMMVFLIFLSSYPGVGV